MSLKQKLLLLLVAILVIAMLMATHLAGHLALVLENLVACVVPMLNL